MPIDPGGVDTPAGSGPYYIATRIRDKLVVLERNPYYPGPRRGNVDRVVWEFGMGSEECRLETEHDEVDLCESGVPQKAYRVLANKYGVNKPDGQFFVNRLASLVYFAFNHDRPAFRGPGQIPLKQAINWAIDRPALVSAAGHRAGIPTDQILPAGLGRDESIYPLGRVTGRSLAKARQLLAKAGLKPAKLVLYANDCCAAAAEIFKFDMKQLGIDVDIRYFSTDVLLAKASRRGEPFDVVLTIWGLDYPDAVTFFEPLIDGTTIRHTGNTNVAHFDRPKYNREIQRISQLTGEARLDAWSGLDVALMRDDPPFAPVMNFNVRDLVSKSFGCYVFQPVITRVDLVAACKR